VLRFPLKWKQKKILKEKLKTLKILFLANCQNFSCWEETSFLTSFLSKIKVHVPLHAKSIEKYRNKPYCSFSIADDIADLPTRLFKMSFTLLH